MATVNMSKALQGIYKLILKDKVKLEVVREGLDRHVWSREGNKNYKSFWAVLSPSTNVVLDDPNVPNWRIQETIGVGIINPRALARSTSGRK